LIRIIQLYPYQQQGQHHHLPKHSTHPSL
jgi:hypothetical protein